MKAQFVLILFTCLFIIPTKPGITKNAADSISVWNDLSWEQMYKNPELAITYSRQAYEVSHQINDHKGAVQSSKLIGIYHDVTGSLDSALYYYRYALDLSKKTNDTFSKAGLLSNIGLTYLHKGDLLNALSFFLEARTSFELIAPGSRELASTYNNIGLVYIRVEDYSKALTFFNRALPIYESISDTLGMGALLHNLADTYFRTGRLLEAVNTLIESIEIKKEINDLRGLCIAYNKLGVIKIETDSLDSALGWLGKAIALAKEIDNKDAIISSYHQKQKIFALQGNYKKAINYNRMALDMALETGARRREADSYTHFASLYRQINDFRNAYLYLQRSLELRESLSSQQHLGEVYDLLLGFEMQKKSDEIALLTQQQKVQMLEIENQELLLAKRNQQIFIVFGILCLLIMFVLFIYFRHLKYKHVQELKSEVALLNYKEQQTKKVLDAESKERKRIGEELHDGLGQLLSLLKMNITDQIEHLLPNQVEQQKKMHSLHSLTDNAIAELRNVSHNLSPVLLQTKGLSVSINDLVNRLRKSKKYDVELDIVGLDKPLEPVIEHSLYRIIQELLNNIIRHADANQISLQIIANQQELSLFIEDNGKGFDTKKMQPGMGLNNIMTRIDNLGGSMDIDSMPNRGTIIAVNIPFN